MRSLLGLLKRGSKAPTAQVSLSAASPAEAEWKAGLIQVDVTVEADPALDGALLVVRQAGQELFEKPLDLAAGRASFWLVLHGHLLPDGVTPVELQVRGSDRVVLARRELKLKVRNPGELADQVRSSLRRNNTPLVLDGVCDSGVYDYADASLTPWFDRAEPAAMADIETRLTAGEISEAEAEQLRHFVSEGYLVMPDVVAPEHLAQLNAALDAAVAAKHEGYEWGSSQRMHALHQKHPAVRELWAHPAVLRMLGLIWKAPALPCQSLSYVFGSQQQHHQDTVHLTPFPAGYMSGVWTALEDVVPGSGELVVFPRTHRLKRVYAKDVGAAKVRDGDFDDLSARIVPVWTQMLEDAQPGAVVYQPKAGTVLIWHENLLHSGAMRQDQSLTRRSIVCHYFAQGAVAYYDSLGEPGFTWYPTAQAAEPEPA